MDTGSNTAGRIELNMDEMDHVYGGRPSEAAADLHYSFIQDIIRMKSSGASFDAVLQNCINRTDADLYGEETIKRYVRAVFMS